MNKNIVKFNQWECFLELGHYGSGRLAIQLVSAVENKEQDLFIGEPIATATVNLPDIPLGADEIIIKNYSENEGMLNSLQKAGLVSVPVRQIQTGYATASVVKKTAKLCDLEKEAFERPKVKM